MGTRRRSNDAPITLFSFQDIITSLSGIMILLVLLLVMKAGQPTQTTPPPPGAADRRAEIENLRSQLAQLQAMVKAERDAQTAKLLKNRQKSLEARIDDLLKKLIPLREQDDRLAAENTSNTAALAILRKEIKNKQETDNIRFLAGQGSKDPVLIVCSGVAFQCASLSSATGPKVFSADMGANLMRHIEQNIDPTRQCLVFMLKPSSVNYASSLIRKMQDAGYDVGWDALEEEANINLGLE